MLMKISFHPRPLVVGAFVTTLAASLHSKEVVQVFYLCPAEVTLTVDPQVTIGDHRLANPP